MKKALSILLAFLTLATLPAFIVSCDRGSGDETGADLTEEQTEPVLEDIYIAVGKKSDYTFVMPDTVDGDVFDAIRLAVDAIESACGAELIFTRASYVKPEDKGHRIYVGDTGTPASDAVMATLRSGEYAIVRSGDDIVIAAQTNDILVRALSYFAKNTVGKNKEKAADGTVSIKFVEFRYQTEIPVEKITVGSADLRDFVIVYAKGKAGYDRPAQLLAAEIEKQYGYAIPVVADTKSEPVKNEILFGPTNRPESAAFAQAHPAGLLRYAMGVSGDKFVINALPYSCITAGNDFALKYLHGEKTAAIADGTVLEGGDKTVTDVPLASGADIRVMTANILAEFQSWGYSTPVPERAELVAALFEVWHPDVAGMQEVTDQWYQYLPPLIGDKYAFLHEKTPDNLVNYSSILYDKTKYRVVASGVRYFSTEGKGHIRLVTWGVFEPLAGGQRFILFNTHWCWDTEEHAHQQALEESQLMAEVLAKYPYPYFCTADYNTKQETANYNYFLQLTGAVDAKYAARSAGVLLNVAGGCGDLGTPRPESGNSIDHIFMTAGLTPCAFATVTTNATYNISDHSPKYLDVKLK